MKNRKKLKAMTLVEIIISLAVFAIMGVILIGIGVTVDNTRRATNNLKNKVTEEAPYAVAHATVYEDPDSGATAPLYKDSIQIRIVGTQYRFTVASDIPDATLDNGDPDPNATMYVWVEATDPPVVVLDASRYDTQLIYGGKADARSQNYNGNANRNLDLQFLEIVPTAEPTT